MMNIEESNQIVYDAIYKNITKNTGKTIKIFDEFGYFKYAIFPEFNDNATFACFGFKSDDFSKIFEYSGKECLASEFGAYDYALEVNAMNLNFNIVFKINITKYAKQFESNTIIYHYHVEIPKDLPNEEKEKILLQNEILRSECEEFAVTTATLFSRFRVIFYSSIIKKMMNDLIEKKNPSSLVVKMNKDNNLYVIPMVDKVILIFGINFQQRTDMSLARVALQELEDAKRHVKNSIEAKYYPDCSRPPSELKDIESNYKQFSNGFISFNLTIKNYKSIVPKLGFFINLRQYIQYHIHSIKTFLHIRMNKKGKELENKLNATKIIPEEYLKKLDKSNFYSKLEKKEEEIKLFTSEFKKVNI